MYSLISCSFFVKNFCSDELEPSGYEVKISQTKIELTVAKKSPRKWNGLERPPNQGICML